MARSTTMPALEVTYRTVSCDLPNGSRSYGDRDTLHLRDVTEEEYDGLVVLEGVDSDDRDVCINQAGRIRARDGDEGAFTTLVGLAVEINETDTCKLCDHPVGEQDRDDYRTGRFCSIQCDTKYDHLKADARDARRMEAER